MTTLLDRHHLIHTQDIDEAREEVASKFCAHRLALTSRGGRLDMVHNSASVGEVGLNYLRYGEEVRITPGCFETFYLVQIPLAGRAQVKVGERIVVSDRRHASLPSPTEPVDMLWSADAEQLIVYLDRHAVEAFVGVSADGGPAKPVVFDPYVRLDSPSLRTWMRLVHLAREELESGGPLLQSPLVASHFEQVLIGGLLAAQPNNSELAAPPADPTVRASRVVSGVLELIEAAPERPWRVAELAEHAGVSPRTLQEAFQRDRGVTPLEELRRVRMARAHRDLVAADAMSTTVTEIATRWGFFHSGRFATTYRAAYQESPSQTLAR